MNTSGGNRCRGKGKYRAEAKGNNAQVFDDSFLSKVRLNIINGRVNL
jgi:hypothetical protein